MSVKKRGISEQKPRAHSALLIRERERERERDRERETNGGYRAYGLLPPSPVIFYLYLFIFIHGKDPSFLSFPFYLYYLPYFPFFFLFLSFLPFTSPPPPEILCSPLNNVGVRIEEDVLSSNDVVFGRCLRVLG